MKKVRKYVYIFLALLIAVCVDNVFAVSGNVGGGYGIPTPISSSGSGGTDGSGGRKPIAFGYRVSIVDSNGKVVVDNDGKTMYVDYWTNWGASNNNKGYNALANKVYSLKYNSTPGPKTVVSISEVTDNNYVGIANDKEEFLVKENEELVKTKFSGPFMCGSSDWKSFNKSRFLLGGCGTGGDPAIGNNFTKYALYTMDTILKGSDDNKKINAFGQILKDCGVTGSTYQQKILSVSDKYLIVEPLVAIKDNNDSTVYVGTVYELKKMEYSATKVAYVYNNFMYINPVVYNTVARAGLEASSTNPNTTIDNLTSSGSSGAFTVSLSDVIPNPCLNEVKDAYDNHKNESQYNTLIETACNKITANKGEDSTHLAKVKNICKSFYKKTSSGFKFSSSSDITSCRMTCNDYVNKTFDTIKNETNYINSLRTLFGNEFQIANKANGEINKVTALDLELTSDESNLCGVTTCNDLLTDARNKGKLTWEYLDILSKQFPTYDNLKRELISSLDDAKCSERRTCPVESSSVSCKNNNSINSITLNDTTDATCLKLGIAYNAIKTESGSEKKLEQSSYDSKYNVGDSKGYCKEKVTFNFPGKPATVKAGTLLKWGTNIDADIFGDMTITRTCYFGSNVKGTKIVKSDSNWTYLSSEDAENSRIAPKITLYYKEAIPSGYKGGNPLKLESNLVLKSNGVTIKGYDNGKNLTNISKYERGFEAKSAGFSENVYVETTAKYDITYGNEFKWYVTSGNSAEYQYDSSNKKAKNISETNYYYTYIGYGLPTSFVTPTNFCEEYGNSITSYSTDKNDSTGSLFIRVSQVGTKNTNDEKYHFDKLVSFAVKDDDPNNNSTIDYSCGFTIENELFDYENNKSSGSKCREIIPKGIDVVFRTVELMNESNEESLSKAFPGRSGATENKSREMGRNWAILELDEIYNILNSDVYNNEPMYHIELDSGKIQKIRKDNKEIKDNGNDPYTIMDSNYYIFSLNSDEKYKFAASEFISTMFKDGWITGTCINTSNTSDRSKMYANAWGCVGE